MSVMHWVRHGPTGAKGMLGHLDRTADLSDRAALARLSAALPPDAPIASSDLVRATATADAIAQGRPRLGPDPRLREMDFGAWDGLGVDDIEDQERLHAFWDEPGLVSPPGGESWDALVARVDPAVDALIALALPHVIVVAHMGVILTQVQRALRVSARDAFGYRIDPLSVTRIDTAGPWHAEAINLAP